jgi:hypothetical protein
MSNIIKLVAEFETTLATKLTSTGTSATITSNIDDDGNALADGEYGFALSQGEANSEFIICDVSGTSLTNIKTVNRSTGGTTSGAANTHRIGSSVKITAFPALTQVANILNGNTDLDSTIPLKYNGDPTLSDDAELATKKYVDDENSGKLPLAGGTMTGDIAMGGNSITGLSNTNRQCRCSN